MAGAFNNAWTLLKNRGFEVDPRYEDERMQRLEQGYDKRDRLADKLRDVNARLQRGGDLHDDEDLAERADLENELYQLMRNPEGARYGAPPMNMIAAQTGPMFQEQQRQQAEEIEAEGIDLPEYPYGEPRSRVSATPPADIGRAGSTNPARVRPIDVFNPVGVRLQQEQQRVRSQLKPILSAEELLRPSSAPNEFITADDFMRPPVQKSFDHAWSLLKARDDEQLMGTGADYSGGMTANPNVLSMAGLSAGDLSRFAPPLPDIPARREAEEQRRAAQLALIGMGPTPMNPLAQDRSGFRPSRRNIERVLPSDVPQLTREQQQAEAARMQAEGLSDEIIAQRQAQAMLADTSVADPDTGKPRALRETRLAEGFQSPGERRVAGKGNSRLEDAANRMLGGTGQRGLRIDTSSMTPTQRQNVIDPETGELGMRRKIRVNRGNVEGIVTMPRSGKGFKARSFEALGRNPDQRQFKTDAEKTSDVLANVAAQMGADYTPPENVSMIAQPRKFKETLKPGSVAYDARHQQLEDLEEMLHQMYSQPVVDQNTGKVVPNPHLGMAERIMQEITENPEPPTFNPKASRQGADEYQGDRPVYRPSTGQFLAQNVDKQGNLMFTPSGAMSMTGVTPVDIEEMGRQAMVDGEIDPRILQEYYDKLDAAPVTADEKRAVRARQSAEEAGLAYLKERGLPTTSSIAAEPVFRTDIDKLKEKRAGLEEKARQQQKTRYKL